MDLKAVLLKGLLCLCVSSTMLAAPPQDPSLVLSESELMRRIDRDFSLGQAELVAYLKQYMPDLTQADLARWEADKSLECMVIQGEKRYFSQAGRNLFRVNEACRQIWDEAHKDAPVPERFDQVEHAREIMSSTGKDKGKYCCPVRIRIQYTISVKPNQVPAGQTIRCWIPFPRQIPERQTEISLLRTEPPLHRLASNEVLQRTVYLEKPAQQDRPTGFSVEYSLVSYGAYVDVDAERVVPAKPDGPLAPYLREELPHTVFTEALKQLSRSILGQETNPLRKAQKLFQWVDQNIPWASAREYSTIRNISDYALKHRHGDCGIKTLFLMTLLRMNGIPARWQSGWRFLPPSDSMHDWGMVYFAPYGWLPMDITRGVFDTQDDKLKWFFLHGMDSYRIVFNDDISRAFDPPKEHVRSETVDSQRGEVEWQGGNLYFDQWTWHIDWDCTPISQ
jgi:transglutaminase-like putative cysteine protease